ncbi:unnamed protein product [Nippostrongylus brasiliensis]|uniref:Mizf protein, putative (inferred by orthology to a S. mansoni protein) n=1 Tax=Nippostrongylus brasiliensis TaxID=27835 RepID=A0A0N4YB74_NIPBR|nr:unnamed protein product [Nippostrongylus brasiliensis]
MDRYDLPTTLRDEPHHEEPPKLRHLQSQVNGCRTHRNPGEVDVDTATHAQDTSEVSDDSAPSSSSHEATVMNRRTSNRRRQLLSPSDSTSSPMRDARSMSRDEVRSSIARNGLENMEDSEEPAVEDDDEEMDAESPEDDDISEFEEEQRRPRVRPKRRARHSSGENDFASSPVLECPTTNGRYATRSRGNAGKRRRTGSQSDRHSPRSRSRATRRNVNYVESDEDSTPEVLDVICRYGSRPTVSDVADVYRDVRTSLGAVRIQANSTRCYAPISVLFVCMWDECHHVMDTKDELAAHFDVHLDLHVQSTQQCSDAKWPCPIATCSNVTDHVVDLRRHLSMHQFHAHAQYVAMLMIGAKEDFRNMESCGFPSSLDIVYSGEVIYCLWDDCNVSILNFYSTGKHVRHHSGEKYCACPFCGRFFSRPDKLYEHLRKRAPTSDSSDAHGRTCAVTVRLEFCGGKKEISTDHY